MFYYLSNINIPIPITKLYYRGYQNATDFKKCTFVR
nr:MAG TPA: hypothetical protein [Caudoviricetes sp.]